MDLMALIVAHPHTRWIPIPTLFQAQEPTKRPGPSHAKMSLSERSQTHNVECLHTGLRAATQPGRPQSHALSRFNILHSRTNGHEGLEFDIVRAHSRTQKSSSNPAFPCSALRIKASPSSPMKFSDSLYRDGMQTGRLYTQEVSFRTQQGKRQ